MDNERNQNVFDLDKNSKQLLNLVKGLKSDDFQNKLLQGLRQNRDEKEVPVVSEAREKFKRHPKRISSESDLSDETLKNGFCRDVLCYSPNKFRDSSETRSDDSGLNYSFVQSKSSFKQISFSPNPSCYSKTHALSQAIEAMEKESAAHSAFRQEPSSSKDFTKFKICNDSSKEKVSKEKSKDNIAKKAVTTVNGCASMHQKLRNMLPKILNCIEEIRMLMKDKIPLPDGQEDWDRRRTRVIEFSTRFSRNYLYQLGREISELQKLRKIFGKLSTRSNANVYHYLTSAHHTVLQALQAYRNHMPTSLPNAVVDKLKIVLEYVCILCEFHSTCLLVDQTGSSRTENLIHTLAKRTKELLSKIEDVMGRATQMSQFDNPSAKFSLMDFNVDAKAPKKKKLKKNLLEGRLSMYSISSGVRKETFWKKTIQALARDKLKYNHVQSRYKTAGFKHRPPVEKAADDLPMKPKLFQKRSSCILKTTPLVSVRNDDDIPTMVGLQNERDSKINTNDVVHAADDKQSSSKNVKLILSTIMQGLYQQCYPNNESGMSQEQWENFVKSLSGMDLHGKINKGSEESGSNKNGFNHKNDVTQVLMQHIQQMSPHAIDNLLAASTSREQHARNGTVTRNQTEVSLQKVERKRSENKVWEKNRQNGESAAIVSKKSSANIADEKAKHDNTCNVIEIFKPKEKSKVENYKNKRRQTITVTGAKNAQLICIRDEDSIIESHDETNKMDVSKEIASKRPVNIKSKDTNNLNHVVSKTSIKISRLPKKTLKQLVLIPQEQVTKVVKYKFQYNKFTKGNYLYQKSSKIKPWLLVDELSERLLDDLLLSLADEIQISSVVDNMIRSEFQ